MLVNSLMPTNPKVSIVLPIHDMKDGAFFLWRAINSIMEQTLKDYEIIITKEGGMPMNTNAGIKKARGKYVKILFMDDYLAHPDALQKIWDEITKKDYKVDWLVSACNHDSDGHVHIPYWDFGLESWKEGLKQGKNTIGSPSILTMRRESALLFDENLSWLLDCDLYLRLGEAGLKGCLLSDVNVTLGIHQGQTTNILFDNYKLSEQEYMQKKYEESSIN